MNKQVNTRQEEILKILSESTNPLSISEILLYFKEDFSKITLTRDLNFLLEKELISVEGEARATKYTISPKYNLLREIDIEEYFREDQDKRQINTHFNFDIFNILQNNIFTNQEIENLETLHNKFLDNTKHIESKTIKDKELERIMIEFSWKSSQIEGNTYSLLDTENLIKNNIESNHNTKQETQMILNHKQVFDFIRDNKDNFIKLNKSYLEQTHSILIKDLGIKKNFRVNPVGIVGTNYKPIDNQFQIEEAVQKMIELINQKDNFFEKSFLSLILISYIQAFEDGNKRTARSISNAILLAHNSIPMSYRAVDEVEYKKASIIFYEINNLYYFKKIFMEQYKFAIENYFV